MINSVYFLNNFLAQIEMLEDFLHCMIVKNIFQTLFIKFKNLFVFDVILIYAAIIKSSILCNKKTFKMCTLLFL